MNRRNYLALMGAAAGALASSSKLDLVSAQDGRAADTGAPTTSTVENRARRMKWWHEAKFGMFIHWGLYSTIGRHEWVMENEGIPAKEYEQYANNFKPKPNFARDWARLAKRAGGELADFAGVPFGRAEDDQDPHRKFLPSEN